MYTVLIFTKIYLIFLADTALYKKAHINDDDKKYG